MTCSCWDSADGKSHLICEPCAREEERREREKLIAKLEEVLGSTIIGMVSDLYGAWAKHGEEDQKTKDLFLKLMTAWDQLLD